MIAVSGKSVGVTNGARVAVGASGVGVVIALDPGTTGVRYTSGEGEGENIGAGPDEPESAVVTGTIVAAGGGVFIGCWLVGCGTTGVDVNICICVGSPSIAGVLLAGRMTLSPVLLGDAVFDIGESSVSSGWLAWRKQPDRTRARTNKTIYLCRNTIAPILLN